MVILSNPLQSSQDVGADGSSVVTAANSLVPLLYVISLLYDGSCLLDDIVHITLKFC